MKVAHRHARHVSLSANEQVNCVVEAPAPVEAEIPSYALDGNALLPDSFIEMLGQPAGGVPWYTKLMRRAGAFISNCIKHFTGCGAK